MANKQDSFVLAILEDSDTTKNLHSLVEFSHFIASKLGLSLMVSVLHAPSLAHYGQVDTLASFNTKEEFVVYVRDSEKTEFEQIKQAIKSVCPDAFCVFLEKNAFVSFLKQKRNGIVLATYMEGLKGRRLLVKKPFFIKPVQKMGINLLSCRNPHVFKTLEKTS